MNNESVALLTKSGIEYKNAPNSVSGSFLIILSSHSDRSNQSPQRLHLTLNHSMSTANPSNSVCKAFSVHLKPQVTAPAQFSHIYPVCSEHPARAPIVGFALLNFIYSSSAAGRYNPDYLEGLAENTPPTGAIIIRKLQLLSQLRWCQYACCCC